MPDDDGLRGDAPRVVWTAAARGRALQPVRPAPPVTYDGPPPWERIRQVWQRFDELVAAGIGSAAPELRPVITRVLDTARAGDPPASFDVETEGARVALMGVGTNGTLRQVPPYDIHSDTPYTTKDDEDVTAALMALWVARAGVRFALEVVARADDLEAVRSAAGRWIEPRVQFGYRYYLPIPRLWQLLRHYLCAAGDAPYAEAHTRAEQLRARASGHVLCGLAYAFPSHSEWANQAAIEIGAKRLEAQSREFWLMASISDPAAARALAGTPLTSRATDLIVDLIERVGVDAVPVLVALADHGDREQKEAAFEALAMIESDEAFAAFAKRLDVKEAKFPAARAFVGAPGRAVRVLAAAEKTLRSEAMLRQVQALVAARQAGTEPAAAVSGLPPVLANPPWLQQRRPRKPVIVRGLTSPEIPDRVVWAPGQRDRFAKAQWFEWTNFIDAEANTDDSEPPHMLARRELAAVPALIAMAPRDLPSMLPVLAPICSLRVAPLMAEGFARIKSVRLIAKEWFDTFPREAAVGLIPIATGDPGPPRQFSEQALRYLASRDDGTIVREAARQCGDAALEAVDAILRDDPLLRFPSRIPKAPAYWTPLALPLALPPIALRDSKSVVPIDAVDAIRVMLMISQADDPYAGLAQVREACDPRSLADFAWAIYDAWDTAGRPPKDAWALDALGHLGDDETADRLAPLIRVWPSDSKLRQAIRGLDALVRIGSDTALMHLYDISQKEYSRHLKLAAAAKIQDVASRRNLGTEVLADRLVPNLGLDQRGTRTLDYGSRQFRVGFDEQLRPFVFAIGGERLKDLPSPGKADDPVKSGEAAWLWKAIKADARRTAKDQLARLERAMCHRRRWNEEDFRRWLLGHPLLVHLVRRLVWGLFDTQEHLAAAFRVAEDGTFADMDDRNFVPPDEARIGIVHRLEMPKADVDRWLKLLTDYQILQPFPQLARAIHHRTPEERTHPTIDVVVDCVVPATRVLSLQTRGWRRGPNDRGVVSTLIKALAGGHEAILDLDPGLDLADVAGIEQTLGPITIQGNAVYGDQLGMTAAQLDDITYSEIVTDLMRLRK